MKAITKIIAHWTPAAFCASICYVALRGDMNRSPGPWAIPFLCFLPMCFFFVAVATSSLQREVRELREQLAELKDKQAGSHDAA
jgi:hypothetical protein